MTKLQIISESLGILGNIGFFFGAILVAKKDPKLFYYQIAGNAFYAVQSAILINISLLVLSIVLIGVNVIGIYNWKKKEKELK